jgi:cobalamin biosynthesis protein CobC
MTASGDAAALPHGGRLSEARARFPDAPEPWLDLSTGINPHAYPLPDLTDAAFARLPEPEEQAELERLAAAAYGAADPAMVVAAPGTQVLISLLPRLFPAAEAAVLGPTYNEHAAAWRSAGIAVREVGEFDALAEAGAAVLCNPNNPDGRRHPPGALLALADRMAARDGLLIVDEAFADLEPAWAGETLALARHLPHPALIVLRSFGKTYGLAGLRLGFALTAPERAATLRAAFGPWAVSGPALAVGRAALADAAWRATMAARLAADTVRLDALLAEAGLRVLGGTRLFRLTESGRAPAWFERLGRAGILVRAFPDQPTRLRFGLPGTEADWTRLRATLLGQ